MAGERIDVTQRALQRVLDRDRAGPMSFTDGLALAVDELFRPPGWAGDDAALDALNRRINDAVNEAGAFYATPTDLDGRYVLRACIIHYATGEAEVDGFIEQIRRTGAELSQSAQRA